MTKHFITLNNKKHFYELKKKNSGSTIIKCPDANLNQEFLNEDIPALLNDLPNLILAEKKYQASQTETIRFRLKPQEKKLIAQKALKEGYPNVSSFLRHRALER